MVDLPQPDGPTSATKSPGAHAQAGLRQRMDRAVAAAIGDGHALQFDEGLVGGALVRGRGHAVLSRAAGTIAVIVSSAWRTSGGGMCWIA